MTAIVDYFEYAILNAHAHFLFKCDPKNQNFQFNLKFVT